MQLLALDGAEAARQWAQNVVTTAQTGVRSVGEGYEELVHAVIRPPRMEYSTDELGPTRFIFAGRIYRRVDFVVNSRRPSGIKLCCSHYRLDAKKGVESPKRPCVIFLHGNASCRAQGAFHVKTVLAASVDLVVFDFGGCGQSEGEYVSLGYYEQDDLLAVIGYLRMTDAVTHIGLWGQSMGAATALMYAHRDPAISAIVVDSPFYEFRALAGELCEKETYGAVPNWLSDAALTVIKVSIQKRAGFDVDMLSPISYAPVTQCPALFGVALEDDFILPYHGRKLQSAYGGESTLIEFEGDHNSVRPKWFEDKIKSFFSVNLHRENLQSELAGSQGGEAVRLPEPVAEVAFAPVPLPESPAAEPQPKTMDPASFAAPTDKEAVKKQLRALGFGKEVVAAAMLRNSTLESCVDWILNDPAAAALDRA